MIEPTPSIAAFRALEGKMSDPRLEEQDKTLAALRDLWRTYPDLRLGQLLANILDPSGAVDYYYYDDAELRETFKDWPKKKGE
jgi:hypothetical protein